MRLAFLIALLALLAIGAGAGAYVLTRDTSITVVVEGGEEQVPEGTTLGEAIELLDLRPLAGDLVSVSGEPLRVGAFPGRVLVNGRTTAPAVELVGGDALDVAARTRREPVDRVVVPVRGGMPTSPQYTLSRYSAMEVDKGRVSGELDESTASPTGEATTPDAVALTFDDGPGEQTRAVLETLRRLGVPATFFVVGERAERNPKLVRRARAYGMAVENHSFSHPFAPSFDRRSRDEIDREIAGGADAIAALTDEPRLFRPPGGRHSPLVEEVAASHGQRLVLWSVDPEDWRPGTKAAQIVRRVLRAARPGSIVLLHDGPANRTQTLKALPSIVRGLRARGLELVLVEPG